MCVCGGGGGGDRAVINILITVGKILNTRNVMFFYFFYMDLLFFLLACVFALLDGFLHGVFLTWTITVQQHHSPYHSMSLSGSRIHGGYFFLLKVKAI